MDADEGVLPAGTDVGRVSLIVNDPFRVARFYERVVGLTVTRRRDGAVVLGDGSAPLLVLTEDAAAGPRPADAAGLFHTAFRVPSRGALGDSLGRIREHWRLDGSSDHHVSEALYLADPEGNGVEIYWDRPREEWPIREDGRVEMVTAPLALEDLVAAAAGGSAAPAGTRVGHVHLEVSSLRESRRFYGDAVGFEVRQEFGPSAVFLAAGGYHHHVGVNTWNTRTRPLSGRGLAWFEIVVPTADDLERTRGRLRSEGATVRAVDRGFEAEDPDGIPVRFRTNHASPGTGAAG